MFRTFAVFCALSGAVALTIGCTGPSNTTQKKGEAVVTYKAELGQLDKQVTELKEMAEKAAGEEKVKLESRLKDLSAKRDAAKKKLEELEKAAAEKWEAVNKEAKAAFEEATRAAKE